MRRRACLQSIRQFTGAMHSAMGLVSSQLVCTALPNGMQIAVAERRDLPLTVALIALKSLPGDDLGRPGLGQLTADLLAGQMGQRAGLAVEFSSLVGGDRVEFAAACLSEDLEALLQLLAEGVMHPDLRVQSIDKARASTVQSLTLAQTQPQRAARRALLRLITGNARLLPTGGEVARLRPEDVQAYHAACYRPERATLVVVGDVRPVAIVERIHHLFGRWPAASPDPGTSLQIAPADPVPVASPLGTKIHWIASPAAVQATLLVGRVATTRADAAYLPLTLANSILGGDSLSSRLMASLREKLGYAYTPASNCTAFLGPGTLEVAVETRNAVCGPALKQVFFELDRLAYEGVTPEELLLAKNRFCVGRLLSAQSRFGLARQLLDTVLYEEERNVLCRRVEAVSMPDIRKVAGQYMNSSHFAVVAVGDAAILAQLRELREVHSLNEAE